MATCACNTGIHTGFTGVNLVHRSACHWIGVDLRSLRTAVTGQELPGVDARLEQQARDTATELGLGDKWRRPITALSQGERQRVAACRALLLDPPLVLADEPTGNLDPLNKQAVLDCLIALCSREKRMLLTVTHDHSLLPSFDRVLDMNDLLEEGSES